MISFPKVSIIIPTYNYARYINNAIESIFQQTYPTDKIEIIVADDGSTDNTEKALQPLIDARRIKYFYQNNQGKASATDVAARMSTGKYVFNLDADDIFLKDKIEKYVQVFETDESIVHVGSAASVVYADTTKTNFVENIPSAITDREIEGGALLDYFYTKNILFGGGSTYAARKSAFDKVTIPHESDMYIDELLIVAILQYGKSYIFSEPYSVWNVHKNNYSGKMTTPADLMAKGNRYLKSSEAINNYIKQHPFDKKIKSIYQIIHLNRIIATKEEMNLKTLKDIFFFGKSLLFSGLSISVLKKYSALNRLLPTSVIRKLRPKNKMI